MGASLYELSVPNIPELIVRAIPVRLERMVQDESTDGRHSFSQRLREALRDAGYPERGAAGRLAKALTPHLSERAIGKWLNAESMPDTKRLEQLSALLGKPVEWLLTGNATTSANTTWPPINFAHRRLPLISWVQAGDWSEAADPFLPGDADEWHDVIGKYSDRAFVLRVKGDSMTSPSGPISAPEGSLIVVDPDVRPENGNLVVAKLENTNEVTFKKWVVDGGEHYLKPLNPDYKPIHVNGNCRIVGVVKQILIQL